MQITDPQGRRNLGGNVNIRNFSLAMVNPIFSRGEKAAGDAQRQPAAGRGCAKPSCFGQMRLNGVDVDGNFMPFDMQPNQMTMNFNGRAQPQWLQRDAAGDKST